MKKNAIILAAGLGSRFKEITQHQHKALLPIQKIPNIERTICYLHQAGISDIIIVTGHLAHQFDYLKAHYGCTLVHNPYYQKYNSIYSFYLIHQYVGDSYIIDADVVLFNNVFQCDWEKSHYVVLQRPYSETKEWIPLLDEQGKIREIIVSNEEKPSLLGISFWNKADAAKIKQQLHSKFMDEIQLKNTALYWDNIPMSIIQNCHVYPREIPLKDAYEMDNVENYHFILETLAKQEK